MNRRTEPDPRKENESREHGRQHGERRPVERQFPGQPEYERTRSEELPVSEREREGERRETPRKFGERRGQSERRGR